MNANWRCVIVAAGVMVATTVAKGDWIDEIPADAKATLVIRDVKKIEKGLRDFAAKIGAPIPVDPSLDALVQAAGIAEFWKIDEGLALVVVEPGQRGIVAVLPVKDELKLLETLGAEARGSFFRATVLGTPLTLYPRPGAILAASNAQLLRPFKEPTGALSKTWSDRQRQLLSESEAFLHVNVEQWRPLLQIGLGLVEGGMAAIPKANAPGAPMMLNDPADYAEAVRLTVNYLRTVVDQTTAIAVGLRIDADRIVFDKQVAFKKESSLQKLAASVPSPHADLLKGLPERDFAFVMGADISGFHESMLKFLDELMELPGVKKRMPPGAREPLRRQLERMYANVWGYNTAVEIGPKGMNSYGYQFSNNPKEELLNIVDNLALMNVSMRAFSPMEFAAGTREKKIGDLDVWESDLVFPQVQEKDRQLFDAIYGTAPKIQFAELNGAVAQGMGSETDPISPLLSKSGSLVDAPAVKIVLDDLPKNPLGVYLLDMFGYIRMMERTIRPLAGNQGVPIPEFKYPAQRSAPVGMAMTSSDEGFRFVSVIRAEMVKDLVEFGKDFNEKIQAIVK